MPTVHRVSDTLDSFLDYVQDELWTGKILVVNGDVDYIDGHEAVILNVFNRGQSCLLFGTDTANDGIDH